MITETNTKEIYDITGLTPLAGGYEFTFPYTSAQDVRVYTTGNRTDTEVSTSNYTIDKSGATPKVVFIAGYNFPAGQTKLTIIRSVSYSQELDLRNGDLIDADKLEGALDDITQQIQQVAEKVDRAILSSVSDTAPLSIPEASQRNNMLLGFDSEGKVIPVLTTDIEQKLAQALAAEESAIIAKNAAENAQHEAESAQSAAETAQGKAETAQVAAESAETSSQTLLASIKTKTEESIDSINTAKTGAVGAVTTQQATSVAAVQEAQNTAESDIAGKRASALTAIDTAKTAAVAAVNTQKETSVAAADREIIAKRDSALIDIQTARTNAVNAITSQKDTSLQEIEQLASEKKSEINSLAANQKADVKQYTDGVVASAKTEIDTEKTTAVTAVQEEGDAKVAVIVSSGDAEVTRVQSVYQTDLNELKGDLADIKVLTAIPLTIVDGYFLNYINGNASPNDISSYAKISVKPNTTYYITTLLAGNRGICFYDGDTFISGFNYTTSGESLIDYEVTTPANCTVLGVSRLIESGGNNSIVVKDYEFDVNIIRQRVGVLEKETSDEISTIQNVVAYEKISYTDKCYIRTPAIGAVDFTPITLNNMRCFVCDCVEGEPFTLYGTPRDNTATRPYMFVNSSGNVYYRSEDTEQINNRVIFAPCTGKLAVNFLNTSTCYVFRGICGISDYLSDYIKFEKEPLTNLPNYFLNNLSYKPIGSLDRGYLCLSCDDGAEELATYTIPMIEAKGVPCTFSLWSTSAVLANYSADVVDAIENHGCELAQHGNQIWAEEDGAIAFTEEKLYSFFDKEQAVWDSLGLVPKSAVCPAHYNNALVRAVAGGRFGVVRSGIDYADNHYAYYTSGARSNLFGMSSQNVNGGSLDYWKSVIDYAYDNHKIINLYWHDWDLSAEQKTILEAVIDYAKTKGITFCTLGEIAHIL